MIAGKPCVLIVEDDPVSLGFLAAAIERLGCTVARAEDPAAALAAAGDVDLLLIDRHLPGCDGPALLRRLREAGVVAPAIGMSAELDAAVATRLGAEGFAATLPKPASLAALASVLSRFIAVAAEPMPASGQNLAVLEPVLDDDSALAATGGDRHALVALRQLFVAELRAIECRFAGATLATDAHERLHRLRASCGFCGAPALRASTLRLQHALAGEGGGRDAALGEFLRICQATLAALDSASV